LPGPTWLKNRTQPIAVENVLDYLLAALDQPSGGVFEIGGPEVMTYADSMWRYAQRRRLRRTLILLPYIPVPFMARMVDLLTPVPYRIACALVDGLRADSVVRRASAAQHFSAVRLTPYESAVATILAGMHPDRVERVWDPQAACGSLKHEGFLIEYWSRALAADRAEIWHRLSPPIGFRIEASVAQQHMLLRSTRSIGGEHWIECRLVECSGGCRLSVTSFFWARGLPGHLLWSVTRLLRLARVHRWLDRVERAATDTKNGVH
jgi:hypothetical protein